MNIKIPFVEDPITKAPSVSLTILIVAVVAVLVGYGLDLADKVKDTSIALEFFGISAALYFGRRVGFKGVNVDQTSGDKQ
jgi:hypothetical protein